jgi:hypothetical protein
MSNQIQINYRNQINSKPLPINATEEKHVKIVNENVKADNILENILNDDKTQKSSNLFVTNPPEGQLVEATKLSIETNCQVKSDKTTITSDKIVSLKNNTFVI